MRITSVSFNKKTRQINVEVDFKPGFSLRSSNTVADCFIAKDREFSEEEILEVTKVDLLNFLKQKALDQFATRIRTKKEIQDYLTQKLSKIKNIYKEFEPSDSEKKQIVAKVINYLEENNYLNHIQFAKTFLNSRSKQHKSKNKLKFELQTKGLKTSDLKNLQELNEFDETEGARISAEKKLRRLRSETDLQKKRQKLSQFLASQGYSWNTISKVLKEFLE